MPAGRVMSSTSNGLPKVVSKPVLFVTGANDSPHGKFKLFTSISAHPKIAIVHDWLPTYAGAERVLEQILHVFPHADLFSIVDLIPEGQRDFLLNKEVHTCPLQKWRWGRTHYRRFLPLLPLAVEQFDLTAYQLVISSSYAVAKGVLTGANQLHLCYCHSPMRYAWDLQHQYLRETRMDRGVLGWSARLALHYLRTWDFQSNQRVDNFFANSRFVADRIFKFYGRRSEVLHPPVDTSRFQVCDQKKNYYVTVSRLVPYKMVNLIVKAFTLMPDRELHVVGDGPDFEKIKRLAGPNIRMLGHLDNEGVCRELQEAKAFVFAAEEDFGIAPVEAQACGTPVIAFRQGGACETVVDGETGLFFDEQSVESLTEAVLRFEAQSFRYIAGNIRRHAERFSIYRFRSKFERRVMQHWTEFTNRSRGAPPPVARGHI